MSAASAANPTPLEAHEGSVLLTAGAALLKGLLESESVIGSVYGPRRGTFAGLFEAAADPQHAETLTRHELEVTAVPTGARAIAMALDAARAGRAAVALVPNDQLAAASHLLGVDALPAFRAGGAVTLVLEDDPLRCPSCAPRQLAAQLELPCLEPPDLQGLRDMVESAVRLSRAVRGPTSLVVHASILAAMDTVSARPNRVIDTVDAMLARRRRRRTRVAESGDVLRMVRRLELNRASSLPSPGERVPVGFVAVGPTAVALHHLARVLSLVGRIPILELAATHPLDEVVVGRLLARCERVVVLEPRPGVLEGGVLTVAEGMRRRGERPALVWGRRVPPRTDAEEEVASPPLMGPDDAVHPSLLARRIVHLLHAVRPAVRVAQRLAPPPPAAGVPLPARGSIVGPGPALRTLRRLVAEVDQSLRELEPDPEAPETPRRTLLLDGERAGAGLRGVVVELWSAYRFQREGVSALRHASRSADPWIVIVCDIDRDDGQDLVRFARGVIPGDRVARVEVETAPLQDRTALRDGIQAAALRDGLTVLIVTDGPPARYDVEAIERAFAEVDRLGFEPRERIVRAVDRACAVRAGAAPEPEREPGFDGPGPLEGTIRLDRLSARRARARLVIRPMLEQVDVLRTQPPERRGEHSDRLPVPTAVHRRASSWRCCLAGFRGAAPGVAARVLAEAGHRMGYAVRVVHDGTPIGAGRRGGAHVLFTQEPEGEPRYRIATVPFGEADLLIGLDPSETLRSIVADAPQRVAAIGRTYAIVNEGPFRDDPRDESAAQRRVALIDCLRTTTRGDLAVREDVAALCRRWFHTERVADLVLLGAAFQQGLVPASIDAMLAAVSAVEASGIGQVRRAFRLGRRLVLDPRIAGRVREEADEGIDHLVRRTGRLLRLDAQPLGTAFERMARHGLAAMPGLAETASGREARRDFVVAVGRCLHWGGADYAERFAQMVIALYGSDRGETGRSLTRAAILPLATAFLIREPIYIAAVSTSAETRLRLRQDLNVRPSRRDVMTRRFLTRFEVVAFRSRLRIDLRSSDWTAHAVSGLRRVVPQRWRGTRRERRLREHVVRLVQEAIARSDQDYARYQALFTRLHELAAEDRLRGMALAEAAMVTE